MKIVSVATLCVLGAANAFMVPGSLVQTTTQLHSFSRGGRSRGGDYRPMDDPYMEGYRNQRDSGYSLSPNHHGEGGSQYERYDPRRHTKDGKTQNERRFEMDNRGGDPRMMDGGSQFYDNRRPPIVESAGGQRGLERYNPNRHSRNGEERMGPGGMFDPRNDAERMRDGQRPLQREGTYSWDQNYMEGNRMNRRGGRRTQNRDNGDLRSRNFNSENSGRLITNQDNNIQGMRDDSFMRGNSMTNRDRGMQDDSFMRRRGDRGMRDDRGMRSNRDQDWWSGNPSGTPQDRREARGTAELLKKGGQDMFDNSRRTEQSRQERNQRADQQRFGVGQQRVGRSGYDRNEQVRDDYFEGDRRLEERSSYRDDNRYRDDRSDGRRNRYDRASSLERSTGSGRRWEEPYRVGDRTMARDTPLQGPQRLDGGTRRQWTFDPNVGSVQLEMWTEGLPLMATVEIFEKGGQKKNSFDVYVEDGYSRPYSTVLDLPRQSGGTILIRNDGPVEYPLVANVQPFNGGDRNDRRNNNYRDQNDQNSGW